MSGISQPDGNWRRGTPRGTNEPQKSEKEKNLEKLDPKAKAAAEKTKGQRPTPPPKPDYVKNPDYLRLQQALELQDKKQSVRKLGNSENPVFQTRQTKKTQPQTPSKEENTPSVAKKREVFETLSIMGGAAAREISASSSSTPKESVKKPEGLTIQQAQMWECMSALEDSKHLTAQGIFRLAPAASSLKSLQKSLKKKEANTKELFTKETTEVLASTLKDFLKKESLLAPQCVDRLTLIMKNLDRGEEKDLLPTLKAEIEMIKENPAKYALLKKFIGILKKISDNQEVNGMSASNLGKTPGPALMSGSETPADVMRNVEQGPKVVELMIENYDALFSEKPEAPPKDLRLMRPKKKLPPPPIQAPSTKPPQLPRRAIGATFTFTPDKGENMGVITVPGLEGVTFKALFVNGAYHVLMPNKKFIKVNDLKEEGIRKIWEAYKREV